MTTKRLRKLIRANFTRLHEASLARCGSSMENMGRAYRSIEKVNVTRACGKSNAEWWLEYSTLASKTGTLYGVGIKAK